ncbi:MAG: DUF58 domain-containing protein [archaeon]
MAKLKIDLDSSLRRLDLVTRGFVNTKFLGNYASAFRGNGLEFSDYRNYVQGVDDASLIDWKASKRVNNLLVKEYVEERNLEVIFLVDVSEKMLTSSTKKLKAEYIAELVASFGFNILKAGDSVGLVLFSDKIVKFLHPQTGLKQFYNLTKYLLDINNYGSFSDVDNAIDFIFKNGNRGSLVILISDFIYPLKSEKSFKFASSKFDLISMMVRDVRDMSLPGGMGRVVVKDPYSGETLLISPERIKKEYSKVASSDVAKIRNLMKKIGGDFLYLQTDKSFAEPLIGFFKAREAKWR